MPTTLLPTLWFLYKFNVLLQIHDGLATYFVMTHGVPEANPFVESAIAQWGVIWGLLYWKLLACALITLIFFLGMRRQTLAFRALTITSTAYGCLFFVTLYQILTRFTY